MPAAAPDSPATVQPAVTSSKLMGIWRLGQQLAAGPQWQPLVDITGDTEAFAERYDTPTQRNVIRFLTFDTEYPNSILSCLRAARDNAWSTSM